MKQERQEKRKAGIRITEIKKTEIKKTIKT
jgi:hypothetical protein